MSNNPWKTLGSKVIYQNPWITLREDQVIQPRGGEGIYSVVEPRGLAIGVLALDEENRLTLVGQFRYPLGCYSWEIIEGASEKGESALDAAKRELKEEAGTTAEHWEPLGGPYHLSNCFTSEEGRLFIATGLSGGEAAPDDTEELAIEHVSLKECVEMALSGQITDALSVIGILKLARRMKL